MFSFLRKTALWIVAVPLLCYFLGISLNQAVLRANNDTFPVMCNDYKIVAYAQQLQGLMANKNPEIAAQATLDFQALTEEGYLDDIHVVMTKNTHLNFLADWIDLRNATYSPGDFLLYAGETGLVYSPWIWAFVVVGKLRKREEERY